jgi:hypothetical protein
MLAPWNRVFLEKLRVVQPVKKFPAFYGKKGFSAACTSARHMLYPEIDELSQCPHPTS